MVRTRNNRHGAASPGKESSSFKPTTSGNRKGRKRQLTESSAGSGPAEPAALSPVPVPGPSYRQEDAGLAMLQPTVEPGLEPSHHSHHLQHQQGVRGEDLHMEPAGAERLWHGTAQEQGFLAPGSSFAAQYGEVGQRVEQDLVEPHAAHQVGGVELAGSPAQDLVIFRESSAGPGTAAKPPQPTLVLPEDLKMNLECPVCARISLPPIMQCRNGHVTCNPCRLKVQSCPMCREIDIDIRNLFAEKAVTFMSIPCEFKTYGCRVEIQYKDKESHERVCKYRPYICPYIECDHKLGAEAVVHHVSTAHREECRRSDGPEITASMILIGMYFGGDGAWSPRVITCFGRTFFDVALTRDRWLHHWVWLLGEEEEAAHFLYEITAFKGNTKYVYGSEVASLRTSDDEIVSEGKCLSISDAIGRRLRDGDKIRYKLKLMRK